jgi:hypothetical protein
MVFVVIEMALADEVRDFVYERYIKPARERGRSR